MIVMVVVALAMKLGDDDDDIMRPSRMMMICTHYARTRVVDRQASRLPLLNMILLDVRQAPPRALSKPVRLWGALRISGEGELFNCFHTLTFAPPVSATPMWVSRNIIGSPRAVDC